MPDTRIVYGSRCTWWDGIDKVGQTPPGQSGHRIPCCPYCAGVLYEMASEAPWWEMAQKYEDAGHPGHVEMMKWARGRCFPTLASLQAAYARANDE